MIKRVAIRYSFIGVQTPTVTSKGQDASIAICGYAKFGK